MRPNIKWHGDGTCWLIHTFIPDGEPLLAHTEHVVVGSIPVGALSSAGVLVHEACCTLITFEEWLMVVMAFEISLAGRCRQAYCAEVVGIDGQIIEGTFIYIHAHLYLYTRYSINFSTTRISHMCPCCGGNLHIPLLCTSHKCRCLTGWVHSSTHMSAHTVPRALDIHPHIAGIPGTFGSSYLLGRWCNVGGRPCTHHQKDRLLSGKLNKPKHTFHALEGELSVKE